MRLGPVRYPAGYRAAFAATETTPYANGAATKQTPAPAISARVQRGLADHRARPSTIASGSIANPADARWRGSMLTTVESVQTTSIATRLTPSTARARSAGRPSTRGRSANHASSTPPGKPIALSHDGFCVTPCTGCISTYESSDVRSAAVNAGAAIACARYDQLQWMPNVANIRFAAPPCERFHALSAITGIADATPAIATGANRRTSGPCRRAPRHAIQASTPAVTNVAEYLTT